MLNDYKINNHLDHRNPYKNESIEYWQDFPGQASMDRVQAIGSKLHRSHFHNSPQADPHNKANHPHRD